MLTLSTRAVRASPRVRALTHEEISILRDHTQKDLSKSLKRKIPERSSCVASEIILVLLRYLSEIAVPISLALGFLIFAQFCIL